jgi:hypothetical protein
MPRDWITHGDLEYAAIGLAEFVELYARFPLSYCPGRAGMFVTPRNGTVIRHPHHHEWIRALSTLQPSSYGHVDTQLVIANASSGSGDVGKAPHPAYFGIRHVRVMLHSYRIDVTSM